MSMIKRKYATEFALDMRANLIGLCQQEYFANPNIMGEDRPFHIYMIARRPRFSLIPESVKFSLTHVEGIFTIQKGNSFVEYPFSTSNHLGTDKIQVSSPWPHTEYELINESGKIISKGKVALLVSQIDTSYWDLLDLEVLYVGQAFGFQGERVAADRLVSHSTLQNIYAEALSLSPDQEIWIILFAFEELIMVSIDGADKDIQTSDEQDETHKHQVFSSPVSVRQMINYTEAALIRYFQPEYNKIFIGTFPNPAHKTYAECYELDINSVAFEFETGEAIHCKLWSPSVRHQWSHYAIYQLHNSDERRGLFDFVMTSK